MPTVEFPIADEADDGWGTYSDTSWPPDGGTWADGGTTRLFISKSLDTGTYEASIILMRWDTSSIGASSTVTSATLKMRAEDRTDGADDYDMVGDYFDFGGEPTVGADWIETANPSIITPIDLSSITVPAVNDFVLNDLTGINQSGFTGIRLTLSSGTPTASLNYCGFAAHEDADQEPQLSVTWDEAAPSTSTYLPTRRRGR